MEVTKDKKKVRFWLGNHCTICQSEIEHINAELDKIETSKDVYGSRYIKGDKKGQFAIAITMRPDFNSEGILTHWHIERESVEDRK
jgi:hypothetical protein